VLEYSFLSFRHPGDVNTFPAANAVGTVVQVANIGTVIIGGNIKKWKGKLVGVNFDRVKRLLLESRAYLYQARGLTLDILA
jgi:5-methylthioadenosine/S-adenosylhomocysteine deaminase